eukprot:747285-Hanusia_phi.AAC.2
MSFWLISVPVGAIHKVGDGRFDGNPDRCDSWEPPKLKSGMGCARRCRTSTSTRCRSQASGGVRRLKSPLQIPELRVGTLDSLMSLSDDLERIDRQAQCCARFPIKSTLSEVLCSTRRELVWLTGWTACQHDSRSCSSHRRGVEGEETDRCDGVLKDE